MPRGHHANPFNTGRSLRDLQGSVPHLKETVNCPVYNKTFDRFPTIELMEEQTQGEIDYYCPYCEALVFKEFRSTDKQCFEVVDHDHMTEVK
ncbi:MAG: hypothetical protein WBZ29_16585 [Methanocella sp.]